MSRLYYVPECPVTVKTNNILRHRLDTFIVDIERVFVRWASVPRDDVGRYLFEVWDSDTRTNSMIFVALRIISFHLRK